MKTTKAVSRVYIAILIAIIAIAAGIGAYWIVTRPPAEETIKIGYYGPLTPPGNYMAGLQMEMAAKIAVDYVNENGGVLGKELELVVADSRAIPEKAAAAAEKLITVDKIVALTGGFHSTCGFVIADLCKKYNTPVIFADASHDNFTLRGDKQIFRIGIYGSAYMYGYVKFINELYDQGKIKSVAMLNEHTDIGVLTDDIVRGGLDELGIPYFARFADIEEVDFVPTLLEMKAFTPRPNLFLIGSYTTVSAFMCARQAHEIGLAPSKDCILVGPTIFQYDQFWEMTGDHGLYMCPRADFVAAAKRNLIGDWFYDEFYAYTGGPESARAMRPVTSAFEEFDCVITLADAINRAGSTDPDAIIDALEKTDIEGTRFRIQFGGSDKLGTPMYHQVDRFTYITQYQEMGQKFADIAVVWPSEYATAELVWGP